MKKFLKAYWPGVLIVLVVIAFGVAISIEDKRRQKEHLKRSEKFWAYVREHNCTRTGFAGKHAEAVYQCDNGLWLSHEVMVFANPELMD